MTLTQAIQELKSIATKIDGYMDLKEASVYANMGETKLRGLIKAGFIKASKNGHRYLLKRAWIDAYYEKNSNKF